MLRALNAKGYLARCATCFTKVTSQSDAGFLIDNYDNPRALWTIESVADNVVALKAETGKYLARCRGCLDGYGDTDTLSVQETSSAASNAQFRLVPV
ncbi:TPA: hypothetical protein N0F65_004607 [Lagenidium giganteum]|uniref:Uncharacterized protein n=1 Tax=Lagenidium giganteum TaxID=4803 RepID=A0AAV2ZBL8_9STRA|nr:TPA: hypothetical protein N0F65_004607 [Lagenidium giganteum]